MNIVYRIDGETVVFAERGRALYVAHIWKALEESKTWGELRRNLPDGEWEDYFQPHFDDYEEEVPGDDEPFEADDAPGRGDGDLTPPGVSGDSRSWEDLSYGTCQQVPGGASGAGSADGR